MFFSEIYQPGVADFDPSGKFGYEAILRIFENTASRHSDSSGDDIIEESRNGILSLFFLNYFPFLHQPLNQDKQDQQRQYKLEIWL